MISVFFPDLAFGWAFVAVLFAFLAAASYMDLRLAIIPKWVSVTALPIGIIFNVARCTWLASNNAPTWHWTTAGIGLGSLDGLLFALEGLLFGFAFYTILWLLGIAGGGDVKLCAAIGAWIGPMLLLWVIIFSIGIVLVIALAQGAYSLSRGNLRGFRKPTNMSAKKRARRLLTFSTPLCLATLLVLYWKLGPELKIRPETPATVTARSI